MATRPKRPRDFNQLAKLIVDIAVGEASDAVESKKAAVPIGKKRPTKRQSRTSKKR